MASSTVPAHLSPPVAEASAQTAPVARMFIGTTLAMAILALVAGGQPQAPWAEALAAAWTAIASLAGVALAWQVWVARNRLLSPQSPALLRWSRFAGNLNAIALIVAAGAAAAVAPWAADTAAHLVLDSAIALLALAVFGVVVRRVQIAFRVQALFKRQYLRTAPRKAHRP